MDPNDCTPDTPCETCRRASQCSTDQKKVHERERLAQKLFHIRRKVMVMSGKGGVGKSTVASNLAAALALQGYQVGILDADIHGPNIPRMLGIEARTLIKRSGSVAPVEVFLGLKAVSMALLIPDPDQAIIWRGPLKHAVIRQCLADVDWGDLDFLFIDLPPGTGDEPLSVANLIKSVDGAVIVTTPQEVALLDSRKAVNFSRHLHVPVLGIVENMSGWVCPCCGTKVNLFKVGGGRKAAVDLGVPFLGQIPFDLAVVESCDAGQAMVTAGVKSAAKAAFLQLARQIVDALESAPQKGTTPFPAEAGL